jgi:MFS family permease
MLSSQHTGFPGLMALASRRFAQELGFVSSMILFSAGVSTLVFPVLVGVVLTHVGIGWGLAIPAFLSLLTMLPFFLTTGRHTEKYDDRKSRFQKETQAPLAK